MLKIKTFEVNPLQVNTYIVSDDTKEAVIVDCGAYFSDEKIAIENYIKENELKVKHLLITHSHLDHTIGNDFVKDIYALSPEGFGKKQITFGNHTFDIIPTPGHKEDAVVFYCKEEKVAFTGDTIFKQSIGRTDLKGGSYKEIMVSIEHLKNILPDDTILYPGHGEKTTMGEEKIMNPFF